MIHLSLLEAIFFGTTSFLIIYFLYYYKLTPRYRIGFLIIHLYFFMLFAITILPLYFDQRKLVCDAGLGLHLEPFKEMFRLYRANKHVFFRNIGGNLVLLMPVTVISIILSPKIKLYKLFIILLAISLSIEGLQFAKNYVYNCQLNLVDIDDLILNVSGGLLFFIPFWLHRRLRKA